MALAVPSHFAGLPQSLLDPAHWATTKNFEKVRGKTNLACEVSLLQRQSVEF